MFAYCVAFICRACASVCRCVGCRLAPFCVLWPPVSFCASSRLSACCRCRLGFCLCLSFLPSLRLSLRWPPLCAFLACISCFGVQLRSTAGCRVRLSLLLCVCVCVFWSVGLGRSSVASPPSVGRSVGRVCVCVCLSLLLAVCRVLS